MEKADCRGLIDRLERERILEPEEFATLLTGHTEEEKDWLFQRAEKVRKKYFGNRIFIRGLIEFTNYCKNDCFYCGIRRGNQKLDRYRLSQGEILECCQTGYDLGFRTFVLQGGEDGWYTRERMVCLIRAIRSRFPDCAITLSVGEKSRECYEAFFRAGADRYLLRHETGDPEHYGMLHPRQMSFKERVQCLFDLKEIGFQVGTGFMVGSPGQRPEHLAKDLCLIGKLSPHMVGIGPFLHHAQTPFWNWRNGSLDQTLFLISILRLMLPQALIPATTALATLHPEGRQRGILAGANVVMPNLSPMGVRGSYALYDKKNYTGAEAAESLEELKKQMKEIGYQVVVSRGDWNPGPWEQKERKSVCTTQHPKKRKNLSVIRRF